MSSFEYMAWDTSGNSHTGIKLANSEEEVLGMLKEDGLTPVSVAFVDTTKNKRMPVRYKKVKSSDLANFCWQLGTMLESGLSITMSLDIIAQEMENSYFEHAILHIAEQIERGESFFGSIKEFPMIFNKLACAMISAGEKSGSLQQSLNRLAEYYGQRDKLNKKIRTALAYPIFVLTFIVVIVVVFMTFIVPRFTILFDQFHGKLPAFTKVFMFVYTHLHANIGYILGTIVLTALGIFLYAKTKPGHQSLCKLELSAPLFGKIRHQAFISMFCRTLSTLISAGVPILDAFDILSDMTGNDILKQGVISTREQIVKGLGIAKSMQYGGIFPNIAVKMAQIGEQSGSLSPVLYKTSEYYEAKVNALIATLLGMLEPLLIVVVGAIVLVITLAIYLPIFSISL